MTEREQETIEILGKISKLVKQRAALVDLRLPIGDITNEIWDHCARLDHVEAHGGLVNVPHRANLQSSGTRCSAKVVRMKKGT